MAAPRGRVMACACGSARASCGLETSVDNLVIPGVIPAYLHAGSASQPVSTTIAEPADGDALALSQSRNNRGLSRSDSFTTVVLPAG
ncbi:MAG: hypothetical protein IPL73_06720 [Candidatus Obscuribacter sp.]|nr:hypothetical protein [Candidatus Obscuribacter sp.]